MLGVPGWWPENESPAFYDDPRVSGPAVDRGQSRAMSLTARPALTPVLKSVLAKQARQSRLFRFRLEEGEESPDSTGQGDG